MTLDDAASSLDVTEEHLKDLIRDGAIRARISGPPHRRRYEVSGADVRKRKRRLDGRIITRALRRASRATKRVTRARPHGRKGR